MRLIETKTETTNSFTELQLKVQVNMTGTGTIEFKTSPLEFHIVLNVHLSAEMSTTAS